VLASPPADIRKEVPKLGVLSETSAATRHAHALSVSYTAHCRVLSAAPRRLADELGARQFLADEGHDSCQLR
jgi:hypothetical protein